MWHWLLTSTTYGMWLPGDRRGSVTSVRDYRATDASTTKRVEHDRHGEPWEPPIEGLARAAITQMKGPAVVFSADHAAELLGQFRRSADHRGWVLEAVSIMPNHCHIVVAIPRETDSSKTLQTLKSYGSRALNERYGKPKSGTWWTKSGSRRLLPDAEAIANAIRYVAEKQPNPLVTWKADSVRE